MDDDQSGKCKADVGMNRVPDVQDGQRREHASSGQQQSEMYAPARPETRRGVTRCREFAYRHVDTVLGSCGVGRIGSQKFTGLMDRECTGGKARDSIRPSAERRLGSLFSAQGPGPSAGVLSRSPRQSKSRRAGFRGGSWRRGPSALLRIARPVVRPCMRRPGRHDATEDRNQMWVGVSFSPGRRAGPRPPPGRFHPSPKRRCRGRCW